MSKLQTLKETWTKKGISPENFDYALDSVKYGTKREHLLENLTADYRGVDPTLANQLLNELYTASGGEFKKENSRGYLFAFLMLLLGAMCIGYLYWAITSHTYRRMITVGIVAFGCTSYGLILLVKSLRGKYRDTDDPFAA